jgi:hypothetical protein
MSIGSQVGYKRTDLRYVAEQNVTQTMHSGMESHQISAKSHSGQFMPFRRVICKPSIGEGFYLSSMIMSSPNCYSLTGCLIGWHHFGADDFLGETPQVTKRLDYSRGYMISPFSDCIFIVA